MPLATVDATLAVNVTTTLPPRNCENAPVRDRIAHRGISWLKAGRSTFKVTEPVELKVKPAGRVSEIFMFMADPLPAPLATVME